MKRIVLTGGGTAGHVTPNLALLPQLRAEGWEVLYIGSENGIEKTLMEQAGVPYYGIPTGKLRRYLSRQNISDMFRVVQGVKDARLLLKRLKPDLVFSKGGFVAVPVVLGAKRNKIQSPCPQQRSSVRPFPKRWNTSRRGAASTQARPSAENCSRAAGKRGLPPAALTEKNPCCCKWAALWAQ